MIETIAVDFTAVIAEKTTSTMDLAKEIVKKMDADEHVFAVFAKEQFRGRGRNGHSWIQAGSKKSDDEEESFQEAPPLNDLTWCPNFSDALLDASDMLPVTFVFPASRVKLPLEWLSQGVGCALIDALEVTSRFMGTTFTELPVKPFQKKQALFLKWPNDIIYQKNLNEFLKISGILCETSLMGNNFRHFFVGIGLNFFSAPENFQSAISFVQALFMADCTKAEERKVTRWFAQPEVRRTILKRFLENLRTELSEYLLIPRTTGQLRALTLQRSVPVGTLLSVNKGTVQGRFLGLTDAGALLVEGVQEPLLVADVDVVSAPVFIEAEPQSEIEKIPPPQLQVAEKEIVKFETRTKPVKAPAKVNENLSTFALDFGNTRIHWSYGEKGESLAKGDLSYALFATSERKSIQNALRPMLEKLVLDRQRKLQILYVSVAEKKQTVEIVRALTQFLEKLFPEMRLQTREMGSSEIIELAGLEGQYQGDTLGSDRALRFFFAAQEAKKIGQSVALFSAGTALTCEAVSNECQILESAIAPGFQMSLDALHSFTARLPSLEWTGESLSSESQWGTDVSLRHGALFSVAGAVHAILVLHDIRNVFLCGGNSEELSECLLELCKDFSPAVNLTVLRGMETDTLLQLALSPKFSATPTPRIPVPDVSLVSEDVFKSRSVSLNSAVSPLLYAEETDENADSQSAMKGVLTSMLRARHRKAGRARPTPLLEDFRKLGGRFENVGVGERLDKFLADHYKFHTRRVWQERVLGGEILVQHNAPRLSSPHPTGLVRVKHTYHLKVYDQIWLFHPAEDEPDSVDSLEIVSDDGDCVVFSKPGNLVIHAAGMYIRNTFVNAARKMGYGDAAPVHRIDRETSGLLLCARSYEARQELSAAFREGTMKKMYLAVCKGRVDVPERFRIDLPMGDAVESRIRLKLWVNGTNSSQASTYFSKLAQFEDYTLLACYPQTGRTNQIRVHLAFAGLWIVGDKMYHPQEDVFLEFYEKGLTPWVEEQLCFPRHLLHNAGIKGPETLKSSVGHSAVFCPFTPDMLSFQPLIELMKNAHLPQEIEAQKEKLREFFEEDSEADFLAAPTLNDAAQFVLGS